MEQNVGYSQHRNEIERDDSEIRKVGYKLQEEASGGLLEIDNKGITLFYIKIPSDPDLVYIKPGVIVPYEPKLIRRLCELSEQASGIESSWAAQSKSIGRVIVRCSRASDIRVRHRFGEKNKVSKKVGCNAHVRTTSLRAQKYSMVLKNLRTAVGKMVNNLSSDAEYCILTQVYMIHNGHSPCVIAPATLYIHRSTDILTNTDMRKSLDHFLCINTQSKGSITRAQCFLSRCFPGTNFNPVAVKNALYSIRSNQKEVQTFLDDLRDMERTSQVEFLRTFISEETNTLKSVAWCFRGSRELVNRVGDLCFWDSTHHMTRFNYKLSSMILVDSEGKSRAVLYCLSLSETAIDYKRIIDCWHSAFSLPLP